MKKIMIGVGSLIVFFLLLTIFAQRKTVIAPTPEIEQGTNATVLTNQQWQWVRTDKSDGSITVPTNPAQFQLSFTDTTFSSSTDCNGVSGAYVISGPNLTFSDIASTMMYCEGSVENEYVTALQNVKSYSVQDKELKLMLEQDAGAMVFEAL